MSRHRQLLPRQRYVPTPADIETARITRLGVDGALAEVRPIIEWIRMHDVRGIWTDLVLYGDNGRGFPLGEVVRLVTESTGCDLECRCGRGDVA